MVGCENKTIQYFLVPCHKDDNMELSAQSEKNDKSVNGELKLKTDRQHYYQIISLWILVMQLARDYNSTNSGPAFLQGFLTVTLLWMISN